MKKTAFLAVAAAVLLGTAPAALAGEQDFTIHNKTGMEFVELYVEPSSNKADWGDELLGGEHIEVNGETEVSFEGHDECKYDILLKDKKGTEWEVKGIDLCKIHDFVVTKKGNGLAWAAE